MAAALRVTAVSLQTRALTLFAERHHWRDQAVVLLWLAQFFSEPNDEEPNDP